MCPAKAKKFAPRKIRSANCLWQRATEARVSKDELFSANGVFGVIIGFGGM